MPCIRRGDRPVAPNMGNDDARFGVSGGPLTSSVFPAVVAFVGATLVVAPDALFLVLLRHGAGVN